MRRAGRAVLARQSNAPIQVRLIERFGEAESEALGRTHDVSEIDKHIADVHAKVGDGPFSSLGLMAMEVLIRERDPQGRMREKTLLRERLNAFRTARRPALAPRKTPRYW